MKHSFLFALLISFGSNAQQEPLSSFYWNNYSYFNPAMSGVEHAHEANVTWRNQWDKVNGAPNSLFVNYGMNLSDKHGIGVNYLYETIGFNRMNHAKVNYNYQLKFDEQNKLALGVAASFLNFKSDPVWLPPSTLEDPNLPSAYSDNYVHLDLGISYYGKNLMAGIGITQIPIYPRPTDNNTVSYTTAEHLFANLRYELSVSSSPSKVIFETQMRTDFVKYSQDLNVRYNWKKMLEVGVGYRTSDAINVSLTGIIAKNYRIGYSYDITINKLSQVSRGTHEVSLGWRLSK